MQRSYILLTAFCLLAGCVLDDSQNERSRPDALVGMTRPGLQDCFGKGTLVQNNIPEGFLPHVFDIDGKCRIHTYFDYGPKVSRARITTPAGSPLVSLEWCKRAIARCIMSRK